MIKGLFILSDFELSTIIVVFCTIDPPVINESKNCPMANFLL